MYNYVQYIIPCLTLQILPDGSDLKPQGKHLATRADYLLKVLKKNSSQENGGVRTHYIKVLLVVCAILLSFTRGQFLSNFGCNAI